MIVGLVISNLYAIDSTPTGGQVRFAGSAIYSFALSMTARRSLVCGIATLSSENWGTGPVKNASMGLSTSPDIRYSFTDSMSCRRGVNAPGELSRVVSATADRFVYGTTNFNDSYRSVRIT